MERMITLLYIQVLFGSFQKYLFGVCLKTTCQIYNGTASSSHRNINNCTNGIKNILTVQLVVVTDNSYTSIQTSELALFCQS